MLAQVLAPAYVSGDGSSTPPASLNVPTTISAGLLTLAKRASSDLKKSASNKALSIALMLYPESKYVRIKRSIASGSPAAYEATEVRVIRQRRKSDRGGVQ